jgi:hypothetical protein
MNIQDIFHIEHRQTSLGMKGFIVIRRLMSQLSGDINYWLLQLAGVSNVDGSERLIEYEFCSWGKAKGDIKVGIKFLQDCGWTLSKVPIE